MNKVLGSIPSMDKLKGNTVLLDLSVIGLSYLLLQSHLKETREECPIQMMLKRLLGP